VKGIKEFILRWGYSTNHKDIGTLYLVYGAIAGIVGTLFSIFIRMELAYPRTQFFAGDYQFYNVVITAHGLIMIFFMLMPALISGFGNWLIPLLIGSPDMAFSRFNNLSFWFMVLSFLMLVILILIKDENIYYFRKQLVLWMKIVKRIGSNVRSKGYNNQHGRNRNYVRQNQLTKEGEKSIKNSLEHYRSEWKKSEYKELIKQIEIKKKNIRY